MVSALYVRKDSIYKQLGVDCWDIDRDAREFKGTNQIIAHPPCRAWGQLSHMAKPRPDEKLLAIHAIVWIRKNGGVLEHPAGSKLWKFMDLPKPGYLDPYGGFTICVDQYWFGHKAQKKTLLYICGCLKMEVPPIPLRFDRIEYTVSSKIKKYSGRRLKKEITKAEREETPKDFAVWLVTLAKTCSKNIF